jgi:hypothetical protein
MVRFTHAYPYLLLSLTWFGVFVVALAFAPRRLRSVTLLSAALAAPFALTSPLVVPSYWNPSRVAVLLAGPEDVLFACASAGIASLASVRLLRRRIRFWPRTERIWWRYLAGACCGLAIGDSSWRLGATPMTATVMAFGVVAAVLLWLRPELWRLAVSGVPGFALAYFAVLKLWYQLVPSFAAQWNPRGLWGPIVFGVPLDEVVWAAAFGLAWPVFAAYLFDARLEPAPSCPPGDSELIRSPAAAPGAGS